MAKTSRLGCKGQALIEQFWWMTDLANCMGFGVGVINLGGEINSQMHCFILQIPSFHFYMNDGWHPGQTVSIWTIKENPFQIPLYNLKT